MEEINRRRIARVIYGLYLAFTLYVCAVGGLSPECVLVSGAGIAAGALAAFKEELQAEIRAYVLLLLSMLEILMYSTAMEEFAGVLPAICAVACVFSFFRIPKINYLMAGATTLFILYKLFFNGCLEQLLGPGGYRLGSGIVYVYIVEISLIVLVKWDLYILHMAQEKTREAESACQAKVDFMSNVSHEIRTPMNVISGMTELMMRNKLSAEEKEYIHEIHTAGKNLLTIINNILDFSNIESGSLGLKKEPYEVAELVYDVAGIAGIQLGEKRVELIVNINPRIPKVLNGDVLRLKQVIINLMGNAVKCTKEGAIQFTVDYRQAPQGILLFVSVRDTGIGIRKEDGEKLFHAFEQIDSRRSRAVQGAGLGLAISKELVALMGGELAFRSEFGEGSDFYFSIPQEVIDEKPCACVEKKDAVLLGGLIENSFLQDSVLKMTEALGVQYIPMDFNEADRTVRKNRFSHFLLQTDDPQRLEKILKRMPRKTEVLVFSDSYRKRTSNFNAYYMRKPVYSLSLAEALNHKEDKEALYKEHPYASMQAPDARILVVDDNSVNLKVAEGLMRPFGMQIDTAQGGEEAVRKIRENRYDMVLMDHMMPGMDGVEATKVIRSQIGDYYRTLPIIAVSANVVPESRILFSEAGMNDFLAKPIEVRILEQKLSKWLPKQKIRNVFTAAKEESLPASGCGFPAVDGVDAQVGLENAGGSPELYLEVLSEYADSVEKKAKVLENALNSCDWQRITIETHALKSASRIIGAMELADLAEELELAGDKQEEEEIRRWLPEFLQRFRALGNKMEAFRKKNGGGSLLYEPGVFAQELEHLISSLEEYDSLRSEQIIETLRRFRLEKDSVRSAFERLSDAMEEFDYGACREEALKLLDAICEEQI